MDHQHAHQRRNVGTNYVTAPAAPETSYAIVTVTGQDTVSIRGRGSATSRELQL